MDINILKSLKTLCIPAVGVFLMLQSCGGNDSKNDEVAVLQRKLDSTMYVYQDLKSKTGDFDKQMADRDSAINAQADEIQRLINQLNKNGSAPSSSQVDNSKLERQQQEIREKEKSIKQLRTKVAEQEKQIDDLRKANAGGSNNADNQKYVKQVEDLRAQMAKDAKQIKELKAQIDQLEREASKAGSSSEALANCERLRKDCEAQSKEMRSEAARYRSEIADLRNTIKSLKSELAALSASNGDQSKANDAEIAKIREELRLATIQLNECRKLNSTYQNDASDAQKELAAANNELKKCQSELEAQKAQVKNLQSAQGEGSKTEQQLRSELAEMVQKEAACRNKYDQLAKSTLEMAQKCEDDRTSLQASVTDLRQQVLLLQSRVEQLSTENDNLVKTIQSGGNNNNSNAEADKTIADLRAQVESQKAQIAQLQNDLDQKNKELNESKKSGGEKPSGKVNQKLEELQALCESYRAELEALRAENEQLKAENNELKDKVASSANLFAENERLQQKVKLASVLVTSDIKVTPGKDVKVGNVVKPASKAGQVKVIRLDCKLLDNNVIDPGSISIYCRITTANNRVVCNGSPEDFSFDMGGVPMQYTMKQDIEFTGYGRNLVMIWRKGNSVELQPGLYWATLYANGYEIGKASFKLD